MIGNDIIDLQLAKKESNWKRPRYLQKIFTEKEQKFLEDTTNKDIAIWILWSRKESAYKIVARMKRCRFYAPKKLENTIPNFDCPTPFSLSKGQITFEDYTFSTKSKITDAYIHTVAQWGNNKKPVITCSFSFDQNDYPSQRTITRHKLLTAYAKFNNCSIADLSIQKDELKIPHLYYKNQQQTVMVSIAHHGHFGGYVLQ